MLKEWSGINHRLSAMRPKWVHLDEKAILDEPAATMNTSQPQPTQETSLREPRRPRIITPSMLRAYCIDDPILDWLDMWGRPLGFERDVSSSSGDPRTVSISSPCWETSNFGASMHRHIDASTVL